MRKSIPICWLLLVLVWGCGTNYSASTTTESQTLIGIDPDDFVAAGACGDRLRSYVATLFDETGPAGLDDAGVSATSFLVASTPPKSCDESTVFSDVVATHAYRVDLQGYVQPAADLEPADEGSSAMRLRSDQSYIAPEWTATCHGWRDNQGTQQPGYAYANVTMKLNDCSHLGSLATETDDIN
jgi:hypothetical protein